MVKWQREETRLHLNVPGKQEELRERKRRKERRRGEPGNSQYVLLLIAGCKPMRDRGI